MDRSASGEPLVNAWAAGVIDSDGCISIKKNGTYYYVSVVVAQSGDAPPMIARLQAHFGGSVSERRTRSFLSTERCWSWQVVGLAAEHFLRSVTPFLLLKRKQAALAQEFRSHVGTPGRPRTETQISGQQSLYDAIALAKGVGPTADEVRMQVRRLAPDAFAAWAAGLIDGDGSIGIAVMQGRYYTERVTVGQPTEGHGALLVLAEEFGGNVSERRREGRPPFFHWSVHGPRANNLLRHVRPHLVQKAEQADVVLRYRATVQAPGKRRTPELRRQQDALHALARELNRYGRRSTVPVEEGRLG